MRKVTALLALGAILAGCQSFSLATPIPQTWIGILGSRGQVPSEEMSLEIAGSAWSIMPLGGYSGVVTPTATGVIGVTLWGVTTCRRYTSFEASPGSTQLIHFLDDGSIRIDNMAGQALNMGPGLVERAPSGCEASPTPA